jgi:hypothetical protein
VQPLLPSGPQGPASLWRPRRVERTIPTMVGGREDGAAVDAWLHRVVPDSASSRWPESRAGSSLRRGTRLPMALLALLGCGGHLSEGAATSGEAGASNSSDAIAPVACEPALADAGAALMSDAEVPLNHRPTPACCPAQRGPGPSGQPYPSGVASYLADDAGGCTSDSQCTAGVNGRCFPFQGLVGPGGCSYDECFTDSNCGPRPCLCRSSSADNSANVCDVGGNCAVDSDCGPGGYCSPSVRILPNQVPNVCLGSNPYYCHTASDLCINDSDCAPLDAGPPTSSPGPTYACAYNPPDNRWECTTAGCALP